MNNLIAIISVALFLFLAVPSSLSAQSTATVSNLSAPSGNAKQFEPSEWAFQLSREYPNPFYYYDPTDTPQTNPANMTWFGVDGVTVDMVVTTPSGKTIRVPAFYYQDYVRERVDGVQILGKRGLPQWKVRFTPLEEGLHQYFISVQDKYGTTRYPESGTQTIAVSKADGDGFVRTSKKDPRYMAFDSGRPFVPIGAGSQWYPDRKARSYSYEDLFKTFRANGVNFLRIWDEFEYQLGVEGAQTFWTQATNLTGPAIGTEIGTANVRNGLRAARPSQAHAWYQRIAIAEPAVPHRLTAWVRHSGLSGGTGRIYVKQGIYADSGTVLGQSAAISGSSSGWTQVSFQVTPNTKTVSIVLENNATGGSMYVDDVEFGPVSGNGISYNIITDGDFERHFTKGNPGNDPDANRNLPRPFGNFVNQHTAFELDKILESARANGVYVQLCSCSGPWFTWPSDPDFYSWDEPWVLKSWQRNFRYRVARWGHSTAIVAWEHYNETGHVPPGSDMYNFYQKYGSFQKDTDIYSHLRTTSQNSQAFSPGLWSSAAMDLANYHDYLDFRGAPYTTLSNDEVQLIQRFAWCLVSSSGTATPLCQGLGLGDGSTWSGGPKPWVWGEIGIQLNGRNIQGGEAGARFLHNIVWTGLFSPMGTTPLDWFQDAEDSVSLNAKWAARKSASKFFSTVDYDGGKFVHIATEADLPPGYPASGERIVSGNQQVRAYALRREDRRALYSWVQNRNNIWSKASTQPTAVSTSLTFQGLLNKPYRVSYFDTRTGEVTSTTTLTPSNGMLVVPVSNLARDIALKVEDTEGIPTVPPQTGNTTTYAPSPALGNGDVNSDGKVTYDDVIALIKNWYAIPSGITEQFKDNIINSFDFAVVAFKLRSTPASGTPGVSPTSAPTSIPSPTTVPTVQPTTVPTVQPTAMPPFPTLPPATSTNEWTQFAHDPQRTSYTPVEVPVPWRWKWAWNGPSASNDIAAGKFRLPANVQPVTGGGMVYVAAGANGIYALNRTNGTQVWNARPGGSINSTVAYDPATASVFAVSTNGNLYKITAATGQVAATYTSGNTSSFPLPPLVVNGLVIYSMGNGVHAVNAASMMRVWYYDAGSPVDTPPAYSASKQLVIAGARNLQFHAIRMSDGTRVWMKKPTVRSNFPASGRFTGTMGRNDAEVSYGWPVVSDQNNLVLVKYRLDWNTMWTWSPWPVTNTQMRSNLTAQPDQQTLFALDLDSGDQRFISNVGAGGFGDGDYMPMGPMPVIKTLADGSQVAYVIARGDNRSGFDGRDDSKWAEMMLNNNTVSGYAAGDVRFIQYNNFGWNSSLSNMPTDEAPFLSMAGNYLLGGHWMTGKGLYIENRDAGRGSFSNPITSRNVPHITTSTNSNATSGCTNSNTHYCTATTLYQEGDTRAFAGPGFYIYYGNYSPAVYDRFWTEYAAWVVSDGLVLYRSTDGAIVALESGNPLTATSIAASNIAGVSDTRTSATEKPPAPEVIPYTSAGNYIGETVMVEGTIVDVFDNRKATYITFSKPHKGSFIVRFINDARKKHKDVILDKFKPGMVVRVRGTINQYQGDPVIYPESPDAITINESGAKPSAIERIRLLFTDMNN
jgi:hypothetical protein